jgi:hypothetical protein
MKKRTIRIFLVSAACLAVSGCNLVLKQASGNLPIEVLAKTAAAQTLSAGGGNALLTVNAQDTPESAAPTDTLTLMPPSLTPTATLTPTNEKVTVTVSRNTNCRGGPEKQFDLVGVMKVGETAEAIGRNAEKTYWVIKLPSNTARTCWLWYEWATVNGNGDALPVFESPPTPTWYPRPDFNFYFVGRSVCAAQYYLRIQVVNTGNVPWESYRGHAEDLTTTLAITYAFNAFADNSGCDIISSRPNLPPGESANIIVLTMGDPAGHELAVTLTLCTGDNLTGTCKSGNFSMTIP